MLQVANMTVYLFSLRIAIYCIQIFGVCNN